MSGLGRGVRRVGDGTLLSGLLEPWRRWQALYVFKVPMFDRARQRWAEWPASAEPGDPLYPRPFLAPVRRLRVHSRAVCGNVCACAPSCARAF